MNSHPTTYVDHLWVAVFPWLEGYVSRKAEILEGLAPDLDWWFSQSPLETSRHTDIDVLCSELAKIFVARHSNECLRTAFPGVLDDIEVSTLELGERALSGLASTVGMSVDQVGSASLASTLLQFTAVEVSVAPGVGWSTTVRIAHALVAQSVVRRLTSANNRTALTKHSRPHNLAPTSQLGHRQDLDRLRSRDVKVSIDDAIADTVAIEGPIELDRLARLIVHRFGYERATSRRKEQVKRRVPKRLVRRSGLGTFVWPDQLDPQTWRDYRTDIGETCRPLSQVPPEEICNAMEEIALTASPRNELVKLTAALFGISSVSAQSRSRLEGCLDLLLQNGRLISDGLVYRSTTAEE